MDLQDIWEPSKSVYSWHGQIQQLNMTLKIPVVGGTRKTQVKLQYTLGSKSETRCLDNWGETQEAIYSFFQCQPHTSHSPVPFTSFPLFNTFSPMKPHGRLFFLFAFLASSHLMPNVSILATPLYPFHKPPNSCPKGLPLLSQLKIKVVLKKKKKWGGKKQKNQRGKRIENFPYLFVPYIDTTCGTHYYIWTESFYLSFLQRSKC